MTQKLRFSKSVCPAVSFEAVLITIVLFPQQVQGNSGTLPVGFPEVLPAVCLLLPSLSLAQFNGPFFSAQLVEIFVHCGLSIYLLLGYS